MYNTHFGFLTRPFASVPQVDQYYPAGTIEDARTVLARCLQRGEGHAMVFGPSGIGKTLLCRLLAEQFKDSFQVAVLASGRLSSRRNLFQAILYELSRPYREMDEGELRLALIDYLTRHEDCPRGMILLVDEAHTLPLRLLQELRMLTDIARDKEPAVRLVMAGAGVLEERFASPKLDSFNQRITARCYLEPLNKTETQDYIHRQIALARGELSPGLPADAETAAESTTTNETRQRGNGLFSVDACRNVHELTEGVPRLINQVCDHALLLAFSGGREQITSTDIDEAWADLQQLPTPYNDESCDGGVIEFGGLDDAPEEDRSGTDETELIVPSLRISPNTEEDGQDVEPSDTAEPSSQLHRIEQILSDTEEEFRPVGSIRPEIELVFVDPFEEQFDEEEVVVDRYAEPATAEQEETLLQETEALADEAAAEARDDATVSMKMDEARRPKEEPREEDILLVDEGADGKRPIIAVGRHEYGQLFAKLRRG